jgi:hypothetical protein
LSRVDPGTPENRMRICRMQYSISRGRNALENYIQFALEDNIPLPQPREFVAA